MIMSAAGNPSRNCILDDILYYIDHSKSLLLQGTYKVYEVSEMVGYRNVDYFHKKFRKYVGENPAEFRKKNDAAVDDESSRRNFS